MDATSKQTFDVYRKKRNSTLRLAMKSGAKLPRQFPANEWVLMSESSVLHSDVTLDVALKGYCYFEVIKG